MKRAEINEKRKEAQAADIATILKKEKLNLYEVGVCFNINPVVTAEFLITRPDIVEKIEKLFEDPNTYHLQQSIKERAAEDEGKYKESLEKFFDMEQIFNATTQRLQTLSGKDVYRILTTPMEQIKDYQDAQKLSGVLESFYYRTSDLSAYEDGEDLYYKGFGDSVEGDKRWTVKDGIAGFALNSFLDEIGQHSDTPEIEQMLEDRIGALFCYARFDSLKTNYCYISNAGADCFQKKLTKEVLKDPDSPQARFYVKYAPYVLTLWQRLERNPTRHEDTIRPLVENYMKNRPDFALELLKQIEGKFDGAYTGKLYDLSQNKDLLPILIAQIKDQKDEAGNLSLFGKILAYTYAFKTGNEELKVMAALPMTEDITISKKELDLFQKDVDYGPLMADLRASNILNITLNFREKDDVNVEKLEELLSGHPKLQTIRRNKYADKLPDIDAEVLITNPNLSELRWADAHVNHPEKLLTQLPELKILHLAKEKTYSKDEIRAFYKTLSAGKPEKLEEVSFSFDKDQEEALMQKYPDLLVNYVDYQSRDIHRRNKVIIEAKKTRKIEDIRKVVYYGGLLEYLNLTDPKDRPSFEDLNKKTTLWSEEKSCFDEMRKKYGDGYQEMIAHVAVLCNLKEIQKEIEFIGAIKDKRVVEYLRSLSAEDMPKVTDWLEKTIATKDGMPLLKRLKKAYSKSDNFDEVVMNIFDVVQVTDQELKILEEDKDLGGIVKQYVIKKQNRQRNEAAKAAFEKYKQARKDL